MNQYLKQMIELSDIDNYISSFEPELEQMQVLSQQLESDRIEKLESIDIIKNDISLIIKKISEQEVKISVNRDKLRSYESKTGELKRDREISSNLEQEKYIKGQIDISNSEISKLEEIKDSESIILNDRYRELQEIELKLTQHNNFLNSKTVAIQENRKKVYAERELLVNSMEKKIFSLYGKIRRWAKETTAVPVVNKACRGCFMKLSDQAYLEVIQSKDIVTCPNCGRLLYLEDSFQGRQKFQAKL